MASNSGQSAAGITKLVTRATLFGCLVVGLGLGVDVVFAGWEFAV